MLHFKQEMPGRFFLIQAKRCFLGQQGVFETVHSFKHALCMLNEAIQFNDGLNGLTDLNGLLKGEGGTAATVFLCN